MRSAGFQLEALEERQFLSADHAGNILQKARKVGNLTAAQYTDYVGVGDTTDFYRFSLTSLKNVTVSLSGTSGKVKLALIQDRNNNKKIEGGEILSQAGGRSSFRQVSARLAPGTYFVRVLQTKGRNNYTLTFGTQAVEAGNSIHSAMNLGSLAQPVSINESVGGADPFDFYRVSFSSLTHLTVNLTNLSKDADLELIQDSNGDGQVQDSEILDSSASVGTSGESIVWHSEPGTYFIRVVPTEDPNSGTGETQVASYTLQLSGAPM